MEREDLTGLIFNGLEVLGFSHFVGKSSYWNLRCSCGCVRKPLRSDSLKKSKGTCTCPLSEGARFGKLTYLGERCRVDNCTLCLVECDCGRRYRSRISAMKSNSVGCGSCFNSATLLDGYYLLDVSTERHSNIYTKVSVADYQLISDRSWRASLKLGGSYYVESDTFEDGSLVLLHRLITQCGDEEVVDHISGDTLDNRSENLRVGDHTMNMRNRALPINNTSGHMGIRKRGASYRARIVVDKVEISLGTYPTFEDAVIARKEAEVLYGFHENHGRSKTKL